MLQHLFFGFQLTFVTGMVCVYGGTFAQFQYASDFNESCRQGVESRIKYPDPEI